MTQKNFLLEPARPRIGNFAIYIVSALLVVFAVRGGSIWIDEGQTYAVISGSWKTLIDALYYRRDAVSGMPLYFIWEFGICQLTGLSEFGMRCGNIFFGLIYGLLALLLLKRAKLPSVFLLLFVANPVFLYYMNEARPYVILTVLGTALTFLLFFCDMEKKRNIVLFYILFWLGIASHMMFGFIGVFYLTRCWADWRADKLMWRRHLAVMLCFVIPYGLLGLYYLHVLGGAPELNSSNAENLKSVGQIIYSFLGFGGLGLSRNDLRAFGLERLNIRILAECAVAVIAYLAVFLCVLRQKVRIASPGGQLTCGIAGAFVAFLVVNLILGTRFWERHIICLLPPFLLLLSMYLHKLFISGKRFAQIAAGVLFGLLILSGLNTIWLDYYQKDDYKSAAKVALAVADDCRIFFQGDRITFGYYGLLGERADSSNCDSRNLNISNISAVQLKKIGNLDQCVIILYEKPEFDPHELHKKIRPKEGIRFNTFRVLMPKRGSEGKTSGKSR